MVDHKRNSMGRLLLAVLHMIGVFANPTGDNSDTGETTVTGQTASDDGNVLTTDSPTESEACEDVNTDSKSRPGTTLSEQVMEHEVVMYNDTKQDTEKDPISIYSNDERLYDPDTHLQTFGGPGPPITKLIDDLYELTLDSLESSQSSSIDREKYDYIVDTIDPYQSRKVDFKTDILTNPTPLPKTHSDGSRGVPSMSTLSQDDMTLDAEMGRPPRINAAGRPIRRQHDERDRPEQPVRQQGEYQGQQQGQQHILRDIKHVALEDSPGSNTSARPTPQRLEEESPNMGVSERRAQPRHNVEKHVDRDTTEHKHERQGQSRRDDENDIMEFIKQLAKKSNKPAPTVKLFDAAILYDKNDYDDVKHFIDVVNLIATKELQEDLRIELFDSEEFAQSKVLVVGDVVERCSVVFIYLTDNSDTEFFNLFCDEAVGMTRLGLQPGLDMTDRKWMLKPVHTQPFKSRRYKIPIGLLTVAGVEWYDWPQTYVRDKVKAILKIAILRRKTMETEKNILLSYEHAFSKEDGQIVPNQRASSYGQSQTPLNTRAHSESVDAYSLNPLYMTSPPDYPGTLDKHRRQYLPRPPHEAPAYGTPPMNVQYPSMPPPSYHPYPQQQYQHPNVSQYGVNQSFQYNPNTYQGQMYAPPQHTGMRYTHYNYGHAQMTQAPPPYQQTIMQDQLSHAYPYTSPHFIGPHGYPVSHMAPPIQHIPQPTIDTRQNNVRSAQGVLGQHTVQSGHKPPINHTGSLGQNGAAFGSLMRDKRDDTPASHELTVVSRLDGRLITNPNLSNDDLEIDTGIKQGKDQSTTDRMGEHEVTSDSSGDSCDSDVDNDHDVNIGKLFRGQGKVVNIIGSSVVQLGKNNKAVEHYQTKKVYQATKKKSRDKKTNAKVLESEQSHAKRHSDPEYASNIDNDDGTQITDTLTFRDGRYASRDYMNSRTENNQDRRYNMLQDQSIKPDLSKDAMSYTGPNLDDRASRDTQNHVNGIQTQTHAITTRDLLNNLDQGESVCSGRRETLRYNASGFVQGICIVSGPTDADLQQINQVPIIQTDDSRQRNIDSRQINKTYHNNPDMDLRQINRLPTFLGDNSRLHEPCISNRIEYTTSSQDDNVDDEHQVSIDDNTSVPNTLDPIYDDREDELFGTGTSDIQEHGQAKFLFSSFRSSVFSKPSSICSDVNVEQVCGEKHDSVD